MSRFLTGLAQVLSHVFDPVLVGFTILLYAAIEEKAHEHVHFTRVMTYAILIGLVFPFLYTMGLKRFKLIANFFYSQKKDRLFLLPLILVITLVLYLLIRYYYVESAVITYLELSLVVFILVALITPITKISLHMTGLSSLFIMAMYIWGIKGLWFGLALPPVAWARLYLNQHNAGQVVAGTFVGGTVSMAYLYLIQII